MGHKSDPITRIVINSTQTFAKCVSFNFKIAGDGFSSVAVYGYISDNNVDAFNLLMFYQSEIDNNVWISVRVPVPAAHTFNHVISYLFIREFYVYSCFRRDILISNSENIQLSDIHKNTSFSENCLKTNCFFFNYCQCLI